MQTAKAGNALAAKATVSPARQAAFEILRRVETSSAFASVLLAAQADKLGPNDRSLCHELVLGVLRRRLWLDCLIAHYARRDPQRLDLPVRLALRLGLYQLRFLTRVPASAAVNESVNLVRLARLRSAEPFANAVLRRATREPDYDPAAGTTDPIEKLAIETSHPEWLLERWIKALGVAEAEAFARSNNEVPPSAFRIVHAAVEREVLDTLRAAGADLLASEIAPDAWRVTGAVGLIQELARDGRIYLQDEASQLVAHVVDAQPGERVLDVCAAPGSKTTHIADLAPAAWLVANDLHLHRLRQIVAAAATQQLTNISCAAVDALQSLPFPEGSFDRVLVDAPCTGTGTLRRNPEIRWRISAGDIDDLAGRQLQILLHAATMVKPGGRLVYSTCSVEPEENEQVIAKFKEAAAGFRQLVLPRDPRLSNIMGEARVWPHRAGADGFFIAALQR
jgi:16S rRNA (cytosine967-C5)-methyltransferase